MNIIVMSSVDEHKVFINGKLVFIGPTEIHCARHLAAKGIKLKEYKWSSLYLSGFDAFTTFYKE